MRKLSCALLLAFAFSLPTAAFPETPAREAAPGKRLRVGLALEGGGALGLAHIGVLQWFEDHHIPIDFIAGTSMGGMVGGLYAAGKSPSELEAIVDRQDWDVVIGGTTDYRDLSFRRKEDQQAFANRLEVGLKHGFSLPSGLNSGQEVSLLIDRETLPYSHSGSFDDLPVPFRCVATDLVTGRSVVFDHGSLAQAIRATMSIPGVFAPVRDGNSVYVDGGLLGNLPTDVVRHMGADVVIAVHLDIAPTSSAQVQSLFSVLGRSIDVVIQENEVRGLAAADLVVNVDLKDFTTVEYAQAHAIIDRGTAAAAGKAGILAPYALDDTAWAQYLAERKGRVRTEIPTADSIEIRGTGPQSAEEVRRFLRKLTGKAFDIPATEALLNQLTGFGKFESADYWLEAKEGRTVLVVFVHEKSYAPRTLRVGSETDGSEPKDVTVTLAGRLTFFNIAGYRSELRADFQFGNNYGLSTELYRPFGAFSNWFFAPHITVSNTGFKFFNQTDPIALYRYHQQNGGIDIGYGFNRFTELRLGYQIGYSNILLNLGQAHFASVSGRVGDTHLRFRTDHTDDPIVPRRGYKADATFRWYDAYPGALDGLPAVDGRLEGFQPVSGKGSIFGSAEGGTTFGVHNLSFPLFFLGAPQRLGAYGTNELFGEQYYLFRAGYIRELLPLPTFLGKKVYGVSAYEIAKMYRFTPETKYPMDIEAGVVAETALGPLFLGGSVGDSGHQKWFFQLGHVF